MQKTECDISLDYLKELEKLFFFVSKSLMHYLKSCESPKIDGLKASSNISFCCRSGSELQFTNTASISV